MPDFSLSRQPRFPVVTLDADGPISAGQMAPLLEGAPGVTLCVRSAQGHASRGGYFFCVSKEAPTAYRVETVEGDYVASFDPSALLRFINHATGRLFDAEMLEICQNRINFRED